MNYASRPVALLGLLDQLDYQIVLPETQEQLTLEQTFVSSLSLDSRAVKTGALFFAFQGTKEHGINFSRQVVDAGASAVVTDRLGDEPLSIPVVLVSDVKAVMEHIAAKFYGVRDRLEHRIAITGTNGKTSVAWIISHALGILGCPAVYLGTLGQRFTPASSKNEIRASEVTTTHDAISRNRFVGHALKQGAKAFVMEVSSHALDQNRVVGVDWTGALFTNLSRDHLDYHGTMESYAQAKSALFYRDLKNSRAKSKLAVLNVNEELGAAIRNNLRNSNNPELKLFCFSDNSIDDADCLLAGFKCNIDATEVTLSVSGKTYSFTSSLIGHFNVKNLLASAALLCGLGYEIRKTCDALSRVPAVPGRMERLTSEDGPQMVVDYAHTPDALRSVLQSARPLTKGRLIALFGCGGDRDCGKRPLMAKAVEQFADVAVVTSDNPRSEPPEEIIQQILSGFGDGAIELYSEVDRRKAIIKAYSLAQRDDLIVVAGKGHEDYQEISGERHPFSDVEECKKVLGEEVPSYYPSY